MDGRKYQSATENPNSLTGPEILGLPCIDSLFQQVLPWLTPLLLANLLMRHSIRTRQAATKYV
jgi:hypothetical protein